MFRNIETKLKCFQKTPIIALIRGPFFFERLLQKKLGDCEGKKKDISNKVTIMKIIVEPDVYIHFKK